MAAGARDYVTSFTTTRQVETRQSIDALKRVRSEVESKLAEGVPLKPAAHEPAPDRSAKFESKGVEGDITQVVGGAYRGSADPLPPKKIEPKARRAKGHRFKVASRRRRSVRRTGCAIRRKVMDSTPVIAGPWPVPVLFARARGPCHEECPHLLSSSPNSPRPCGWGIFLFPRRRCCSRRFRFPSF